MIEFTEEDRERLRRMAAFWQQRAELAHHTIDRVTAGGNAAFLRKLAERPAGDAEGLKLAKEALEEIQGEAYLWGQGEPEGRTCGDCLGHVMRVAQKTLAALADSPKIAPTDSLRRQWLRSDEAQKIAATAYQEAGGTAWVPAMEAALDALAARVPGDAEGLRERL